MPSVRYVDDVLGSLNLICWVLVCVPSERLQGGVRHHDYVGYIALLAPWRIMSTKGCVLLSVDSAQTAAQVSAICPVGQQQQQGGDLTQRELHRPTDGQQGGIMGAWICLLPLTFAPVSAPDSDIPHGPPSASWLDSWPLSHPGPTFQTALRDPFQFTNDEGRDQQCVHRRKFYRDLLR